jgi:hypothetical protein
MKFSEFCTFAKPSKKLTSAKQIAEAYDIVVEDIDDEEDLKRQMQELTDKLAKARNSGDKKTAFLIGGDLAAVMSKLMELDLVKRHGMKFIKDQAR